MDPFPDRPAPSRALAERIRDWIAWFGLARLIGAVVAVCLAGAGGFWLLHSPPPTTESRLPYAAAGSTVTPTSGPGAEASPLPVSGSPVAQGDVVVHVAGAVALPGVYHLGGDARVIDAVAAAGGLAADADSDALNLAALLRDGDRVFVPHMGLPVPAVVGPVGGSPGESSGPVNLNTATADELDALPGVGPSTAASIVAYRDQHGPFGSVEGLLDVRGIGPAKLDGMRGLVTV